MYQSIEEEAWGLVHALASQCSSLNGIGTMTPAAYDTAWVAMVEKIDQGGKMRAVFPEAYSYLEKTQSKDGSWGAETSDTDGIVNTLAALLAFKKQERRQVEELKEIQNKCQVAEKSLRRLLEGWNVESSDRVGMELLVPNLLRLLEGEDITFDFASRKALLASNAAKLARLGPALASPEQTTLIHTLEAFVGTLDFDRVKQHRMPNGSMMASPASTAAYLMNATEWDDEAEAYLRVVFERQSDLGHKGGFPSAYPSTNFEVAWVLSTLLESGFNKDSFLMADIRSLTGFLEATVKQGKGTVGWVASCLPDADDTAKTISTLILLGWEKDVVPMLKSFETDAHFITYQGERNASASTNCNVLICLLRTIDPAVYIKQIVKCATFIAREWSHNSGPDKWHTSMQYSMMLTAQALLLLLKRWANNELGSETISQSLLNQDIPQTLLGILANIMSSQNDDGSWEYKREVTAYAVLNLAAILSLPWIESLKSEGTACMLRGKAYLESNRNQWRAAERIWVEKTVYGSPSLSQAYCLAASKIEVPMSLVHEKIFDMFSPIVTNRMTKLAGLFGQVSPFFSAPKWKLQLSILQSATYTAILKDHRYDIFPPTKAVSDEKYQDYIPFTWIGCRDLLSTHIPPNTLWDMMQVSMLNFQVDAFMETVVRACYNGRLGELKALINSLFGDHLQQGRKSKGDGNHCAAPLRIRADSNDGTDTTNGLHEDASNGAQGGATSVLQNGTMNGKGIIGGKDASNGSTTTTTNGNSGTNGDRTTNGNGTNVPPEHGDGRDKNVKNILTKFINFALQQPKVLASPAPIQEWLAHEMRTFLLAHVTHMEDCDALALSANLSNGSVTWSQPRATFFNWVRTTSADHTSCPYSFVFYLCLVGKGGTSLDFNIQQRYALEDACRHLAAMCRQYNDFGSVLRDHEEGNLNSVNFPEFVVKATDTVTTPEELFDLRKRDLLAIAEYERRCLDRVLGELELTVNSKMMETLRLFVQVTDLYGQIYVVRDIGIRQSGNATAVGK